MCRLRDYLYVWHEPSTLRLILSGVEFRDFLTELTSQNGIVLLRHKFDDAAFDGATRLDWVPTDRLARLAADDIYGYGDFCWADIGTDSAFPGLSDDALAELAFFGQMARPFRGVAIPGLNNDVLCFAHDDGWYARLYYVNWETVRRLLQRVLQSIAFGDSQITSTLDQLQRGEGASWCRDGTIVMCEQTEDVDAVIFRFSKRK